MKNWLFILALALSGCTYSVHQVGFSDDIPVSKKKSAKLIHAQADEFVILGFEGDTNYVNKAYAKLIDQCPQGNIGGIATKFYSSHGFLSWTSTVDIEGFCY